MHCLCNLQVLAILYKKKPRINVYEAVRLDRTSMIMPYERGKKESWVKIVKFDTQGTEMAFEEATERYLLAMIPFFLRRQRRIH